MSQLLPIFLAPFLALSAARAQGPSPESLRVWAERGFFGLPSFPAPVGQGAESRRPEAGFAEGAFTGAKGAKIGYLYRPGDGPGILVVHGTILAGEAQKQGARGFFPGRPVMALYRRGYGPSEAAETSPETIGAENAEDIALAIGQLRSLTGGRKVGVMAFSLAAMLLPELDAETILWVALVNPAASGMLAHMPAEKQALSWTLKNTYELSRYWHPAYRDAWIGAASRALTDDLIYRIRSQSQEGDGEFADFLVERIHARLRSKSWRKLIVEERLWALFPAAAPVLPRGVPVLVAAGRSDGLIPAGAHEELLARVRRSAAWVRDVRWPGGHLAPVFAPDVLIEELGRFDAEARAVAFSRP